MRKAVGRSSCKKVPSATSTNKTGRLEVRPDGWCAAPCVACSLPLFRPNLASGQNSTIPLETRRFDHVLRGRTVKINATSTRITRRGYRVSGILHSDLTKTRIDDHGQYHYCQDGHPEEREPGTNASGVGDQPGNDPDQR